MMKNIKNLIAFALVLGSLTTFAQPSDLTSPYLVTTSDDTLMCSEIKIKTNAVTCQTESKKVEMRNEFIRRIYLPVDESAFDVYFKSYAEKGDKRLYPYGPKTTAKVLSKGKFPRFFDMRPIDAEKDFWTRGLFEILATNNGYKLCKIRKNSQSSFASTGDKNPDAYFLFEDGEENGVELTPKNFNKEIAKLVKGCSKAMSALNNSEINHMKDLPGFLATYAQCD